MTERLVKIYDVTLRDGTQGENISFSIHDKIRIASKPTNARMYRLSLSRSGRSAKNLCIGHRSEESIQLEKEDEPSLTELSHGADNAASLRRRLDL